MQTTLALLTIALSSAECSQSSLGNHVSRKSIVSTTGANGLGGLLRTNMQHTHHFVILVGENVTMPHVTAGLVKEHANLGDLARKCNDNVLLIREKESWENSQQYYYFHAWRGFCTYHGTSLDVFWTRIKCMDRSSRKGGTTTEVSWVNNLLSCPSLPLCWTMGWSMT